MVTGFKGFRADFTCRGLQYAVGKTVSVSGPLRMCENGLHFCKNPLEVFNFYEPSEGFRYARVSSGDEVLSTDFGTKCCASSLTVGEELSVEDMIYATRGWFREHVQNVEGFSETVTSVIGTGLSDVFVISASRKYYVPVSACLAVGAGFQNCVVNHHGMAITLGATSLALSAAQYKAVAISEGPASAASADYPCSVAIAKGGMSVAHTDGYSSVAVTQDYFSLSILGGANSMAMSTSSTSTVLVKPQAMNSMVMAAGDVIVQAPGCIVMICKSDFSIHASITAVAGTRLFIPLPAGEESDHVWSNDYAEVTCGEDPGIWEAGVETQYCDIINSYVEKQKCTTGT